MTHVSTEIFTTGRMAPSGTNNLSAEVSIHPKHWLLTGDTTGTNSQPVIGIEHTMLIQNEEFKLLSVMSTYII
jgi:hypothetical protein